MTMAAAVRVALAVNVGGISTTTSGSSCERMRKLVIPRQYRSRVKTVMTVTRLYMRFCETVRFA